MHVCVCVWVNPQKWRTDKQVFGKSHVWQAMSQQSRIYTTRNIMENNNSNKQRYIRRNCHGLCVCVRLRIHNSELGVEFPASVVKLSRRPGKFHRYSLLFLLLVKCEQTLPNGIAYSKGSHCPCLLNT